ncbi:MAG: LytTR family transcriptional regulator [Anaerolineaceae bacterium]|nr:LytTR family transcriptional regulator [Anaerolineaceae bacterium]
MKNTEVLFDKNPDLKNIIVTVSASETDEQVRYLMDLIRNSGGNDIYVENELGRQFRITEDRIIRIQTNNKNVSVYTPDGVYSLRKSLQETEAMLHSRMFLKISRFEIINLQKVSSFDFTIAGTLRIEFEDGSFTWASRRFIPLIRQRLSEGKEEL